MQKKRKKNKNAELKQITLFEKKTNFRDPGMVILTRGAG